ncbi:MAG: hypothetical protein PSV23_04640 [Brevundimonas sp.]|uniref:hypothetical protein n=1 Tax=Brevundimonas sp. TaxID=1871086 RepID=UPI002489F0A9|nr:hypothetical protein [Brevundimonas sp.]MDI1326070.1 hypothetical protein [Brevundimonas sp.]
MKFASLILASGLLALPGSALAQVCEGCTLTVAGDEAPKVQAWTQPAAFSYVSSSESSEDRATLDLAVRHQAPVVSFALPWVGDADHWFVRGLVHISDQEKKEQEAFALGLGVKFQRAIVDENAPIEEVDRAWFLQTDSSVAFASKVVFPDRSSAACVLDPTQTVCGEQTQQSVRIAFDFLLYNRGLETRNTVVDSDGDGRLDNEGWVSSFSPPTLRLFHDEVTQAVLGDFGEETGGVTGARAVIGFAVSPPVFQNRIVMRSSYQRMWAFSVSDERANSFPEDSDLFTASIDFELGHRSFESGPGWQPSIGINYSSGEDPLDGRIEKEETVVGFRLTYKPPG